MSDRFGVRVEVWAVGADSAGLWLLSGEDAWRSDMVAADSEPHAAVEDILARVGALETALVLHSTSWRTDGDSMVLTYMAVIDCPGLVRDDWSAAKPVSSGLVEVVGRPLSTATVEAPIPRYVDVLMHGLRHLRFLLNTDSTVHAALNQTWREHLAAFTPVLAGMYDQQHDPEHVTITIS
ncbi:MAG: hypothetical protein ACRDT0_22980 [Pseudonocardiaceae bacterium]